MKTNKVKKKGKIIFFVLLTLLLLYFILRKDFFQIVHEILNINLFWLLVSIFLIFAYWFFRAIILHKVVLSFKANYTFKKAFRLQMITQFFNAVTPFASGGQPFQIYSLKKDGISYNDGANIVVQEFIVYQIALVFLGIFAITYNYFFPLFPEVALLEHLVTLGFIINFMVIVFLFILAFVKKFDTFLLKLAVNLLKKFHLIKNKKEVLERWNTQIDNFNTGAKKLINNKYHFFHLIFLEIVSLLSLYLIPCTLLYGMGDYTSITGFKAIITSAYVMLIGSFVPIPGGTGGLEYGFLAFFGNFIKGPILKALMLLWRFITYYFGMIVGAIAFNWKGDRK